MPDDDELKDPFAATSDTDEIDSDALEDVDDDTVPDVAVDDEDEPMWDEDEER